MIPALHLYGTPVRVPSGEQDDCLTIEVCYDGRELEVIGG